MKGNISTPAIGVAICLLVSVVTQLLYMALLGEVGIVEGWPLRSSLWTIETLTFALLASAAIAALAHDPGRWMIWSTLAVAGIFNALQAGFGLGMFLPASEAGESFAPVMQTILSGTFLFYFLGKALIGLAGIGLAMALFGRPRMATKAVAVVAGLTGLAAFVINVAAMRQGTTLVFPAGAAGTAAALMVAIAIFLAPRSAGGETA